MIFFKDLGIGLSVPDPVNTGLGNQFFQIASTVGHALKHNDIAIFPKWRGNDFIIGVDSHNMDDFEIGETYYEQCFQYVNIPYINNMNLSGYFQSEKYFSHCKDTIKKIFTLRDEFKNQILDKWNSKLNNSLSIHVRRGDYLHKQHYHPCPSIDYFNNGINYIKNLTKIDNILIFSDDVVWCKDNFKGDDLIFVENQADYEDLYLMSYCNHHIITNSSFSWWASWLNNNENKIVIAPKIWFGQNSGIDWNDIYYEKMIIL